VSRGYHNSASGGIWDDPEAGISLVDPPRPQSFVGRLPRLFGRALIRLYRYTLSPLVGFHCRHLPTCSEFGDEALTRYGLWAGGWMTLARLSRCHPWGTSGIDRVPGEAPAGARWYLPWRFGRWSWRQPDDGQA
jgi:putative membrane protein insertion efficiency factor